MVRRTHRRREFLGKAAKLLEAIAHQTVENRERERHRQRERPFNDVSESLQELMPNGVNKTLENVGTHHWGRYVLSDLRTHARSSGLMSPVANIVQDLGLNEPPVASTMTFICPCHFRA